MQNTNYKAKHVFQQISLIILIFYKPMPFYQYVWQDVASRQWGVFSQWCCWVLYFKSDSQSWIPVTTAYVSSAPVTHWGRVTHICIGKLINIGSDNGLWPGRRQAIIWTNAGIFLIGPLGTNFTEISIVNHTFSFKKMHLKMLSAK